jgi:hypothetical protein
VLLVWRRLHPLLLVLAVALLALLFANVEIQIEGPHGWAAKLPVTFRMEGHWALNLFWGGRPLTGYHVWIFSFMLLAFHLPLIFAWQWSLKLEARVLGCVMLFWVIEDLLWFVLNPAYGWGRLISKQVPWHKHWLLGLPTDYWTFSVGAVLLIGFSFWRGMRAGARSD